MSFLARIPVIVQVIAAIMTILFVGGSTLSLVTGDLLGISSGDDSTPTPRLSDAPSLSPEEFEGTRDIVVREQPNIPPVAILTDIRASEEVNFDRITFEFRDNLPGYRFEYREEPDETPVGPNIDVAGDAFMEIRFTGARAHEEGESTITDREVVPELPSVREIEISEDIEATVSFMLGLTQPLDYRVTTANDPIRVIFEVAHPQ